MLIVSLLPFLEVGRLHLLLSNGITRDEDYIKTPYKPSHLDDLFGMAQLLPFLLRSYLQNLVLWQQILYVTFGRTGNLTLLKAFA